MHVFGAYRIRRSRAPARNLFHVSQALSWIAGTRNTMPERLEYVKAIPRLMEPFTEAVDHPKTEFDSLNWTAGFQVGKELAIERQQYLSREPFAIE